MLTVIICVSLIAILVFLFWEDDSAIGTGAAVFAIVLLLFGLIFPFILGVNIAKQQPEPSIIYQTTKIDGKYYYMDGGKWNDVLTVPNLEQSDKLLITSRKAPQSVWYWPMSYMKAEIPVVHN